MKEFEPSPDFVAKVMDDVRAYEKKRKIMPVYAMRILGSRPARWAVSAMALMLGSWNLVRLYFSLLAPVVCR